MAQRKNIMVNGVLTPVWQTDATAQEIDDAAKKTAWQCNPNLLDNWYFVNPVNQRGQTSYSGAEYTVDRWKRYFSEQAGTTIISDGLHIVGKFGNLDQKIAPSEIASLRGRTVTMALLSRGNVGLIGEDAAYNYYQAYSNSAEPTITVLTFHVREDADSLVFHIQPQDGNEVVALAAKLELGDQQTLAHKEGDAWVLNEIPDYGEQLRRCQRYYYAPTLVWTYGYLTSSKTQVVGVVPFPVTMRANPVLVGTPTATYARTTAGGNVDVAATAVSADTRPYAGIINFTTDMFSGSDYVNNTPMTLQINNSAFSADL